MGTTTFADAEIIPKASGCRRTQSPSPPLRRSFDPRRNGTRNSLPGSYPGSEGLEIRDPGRVCVGQALLRAEQARGGEGHHGHGLRSGGTTLSFPDPRASE